MFSRWSLKLTVDIFPFLTPPSKSNGEKIKKTKKIKAQLISYICDSWKNTFKVYSTHLDTNMQTLIILRGFFPVGICTRFFYHSITRIFLNNTRPCYTVVLLLSWRDWACGIGRPLSCCTLRNLPGVFNFHGKKCSNLLC